MHSSIGRSRGFTLVEILVVIVIIASLAGMATLSMGSSGKRVWTNEAQRLAALLQLVADRALIDKIHYGVVLEQASYSVVRFEPETMTWLPLDSVVAGTRASRFATHELPEIVRLEVIMQAELPAAESTEFAEERDAEEKVTPQFVALSSGEVLPVEVAMFLVEGGEDALGVTISYTSFNGLQLEWQADDF
ncbi:type II secretion system minor pseudopilin GspH [Microbulbifer sp. OS29]|uniref:Type II secretion system protein H n=1 Tax=Microbulbifer okhotskensis TaxID=2926617 RepID=A0A9X2ENX1_9GAMM|nr:type II secretion system minor pseudopilin GspH [Microbulbifer okhotskensis]MCO1335124.1 type II secretion system minor pseudopilin GspH [Microbulbifer okhotskensis]